MNPDAGDLALTCGWGHGGKDGVTMPGKGKAVRRDYTLEGTHRHPGRRPNPEPHPGAGPGAPGRNHPGHIPERDGLLAQRPREGLDLYIGGYQVIKKWRSYPGSRSSQAAFLTPEETRGGHEHGPLPGRHCPYEGLAAIRISELTHLEQEVPAASLTVGGQQLLFTQWGEPGPLTGRPQALFLQGGQHPILRAPAETFERDFAILISHAIETGVQNYVGRAMDMPVRLWQSQPECRSQGLGGWCQR